MRFEKKYIELLENNGEQDEIFADGHYKLKRYAKILRSYVQGPIYLNRYSQIGPDATVGKYFGMNADCYVARATVGHFCSFGARTSINPFNHPVDWLSIHEFQYHPTSFDWIEEYVSVDKKVFSSSSLAGVSIGHDVWTGHNVNIMAGVKVGTGAIIGAGSVVTKDVPDYAIVVGAPAKFVKYRFKEKTIERLLALAWWELGLDEISNVDFSNVDIAIDQISQIKEKAGRS